MVFLDILAVLSLITLIGHCSCREVARVKPYTVDDEEMDCPTTHTKWITQLQVPWGIEGRAYMTVPPELVLAPSTIPEAGLGIYATTFLSAYTWLAEYDGEVVVESRAISDYAFKIPRKGIVAHFVDAYNIPTSNWSRWVNCARRAEEESVQYVYCGGRVYLMLTKDVAPGHELLFYYGDDYADMLGIYYKIKGENQTR